MRYLIRTAQALGTTALLAMAVGCNQSDPGGSPEPGETHAGTHPASTEAASPASGGGGGGGIGGEARVELSGDVSETVDLPANAFSWFDGYLNASWLDDSGGMLIIAGQADVGSFPSDADLPLTLDTAEGSFTSSGGECTIEFTRVDESGVEGSFECTDVIGGPTANLVVDMAGTFSAEN